MGALVAVRVGGPPGDGGGLRGCLRAGWRVVRAALPKLLRVLFFFSESQRKMTCPKARGRAAPFLSWGKPWAFSPLIYICLAHLPNTPDSP